MAFITDLQAHVDIVRAAVGDTADGASLPALLSELRDDDVVALIRETSAAIRSLESLRITATGVVATRSTPHAGHSGLSQTRGQGSTVSLVQQITGSSRTEAVKQVRLGKAILADVPSVGAASPGDNMTPQLDGDDAACGVAPRPWHAPLGDALLEGTLTATQHDVILRNLGEPPSFDERPDQATMKPGNPVGTESGTGTGTGTDGTDTDTDGTDTDTDGTDTDQRATLIDVAREEARSAWQAAAEQLVEEALCRTTEDLAAQARAIRDILDPEGAQRRFDERYQRRSFRTWLDADGVRHGSIIFDDEGALWLQTITDTALAPRRGVRFVDDSAKDNAQELAGDPRSIDQLAYDLLIDVLRAGALADADTVFGTRQAGIRLVVTAQAASATDQGGSAVASVEGDSTVVPAWLALKHACNTSVRHCTLDTAGNPLDLGREARLFSAGQKAMLALHDGGCRWPDCDRPAHYCEAHHIDGWASGGRTDADRGILLCRFHHMQLHHGGWAVARDGKGDFVLHPPGGPTRGRRSPIVLHTRAARRYLWRSSPPPPRFRPTGPPLQTA